MAMARSGNKRSFLPALARKPSSPGLEGFPRSLGSKNKKFRVAVVGAGHMGRALAEGLLKSGIKPKDLIVADRSLTKTEFFWKRGVGIALNAWYPTHRSRVVFLAVKPDSAEETLTEMKPYLAGKTLVSLVAGLPLKKIRTLVGRAVAVVRIMPNLPVACGAGVVGVFFSPSLSHKERKNIRGIVEGLGILVEAKRESDLETLTVLSGSGPGVVSYLINSLASFGRKAGLSQADAEKLAQETFRGTVLYAREFGISPSSLERAVATKGGVTEAIIKEFRKNGVGEKLARGLKKGIARVRAMRRA